MQIDAETPRKNMTIAGFTLPVPQPFAEGHVLSESEAQALNGVLAENLRNNFAGKHNKFVSDREELIKAGKEAPAEKTLEQIAAEFEEYAAGYEFGVRRTGGGGQVIADPVEREAISMAKEVIKRAIVDQGMKVRDVGNEKITELAQNLVASNGAYREEAKRRIEMAKNIGAAGLDLGLPSPAAATETPATETPAEA